MTSRSTVHATFVIERVYGAPPARVFQAFADPVQKARWFAGPADWDKEPGTFDFRVGGHETSGATSKSGHAHHFRAVYQDIVQDERIVYTYDMDLGGPRISVSLTTIEIRPEGSGSRLTFTEQGVFLDGYDDAGSREHGSGWLLDKLGESLKD